MKKSLILIAIMLLMFFINNAVVNASMDVNLCSSSGTCSGNMNPVVIYPNTDSSSFNYTVSGSTSNPDDGLRSGQRWRVVADYCATYVTGLLTFDKVSSVGVTINDSMISSQLDGTCTFTESNGTVRIGRPLRFVNDFTINTNGVFYLRYFYGRYVDGSITANRTWFMSYDLQTGDQIATQDAADLIINNDNFNTQSIIDNNNANTDRIVNSQNATTSAVNNNTNAVNNMNSNMTSTNTSGSESFLTSIINDPAFQDNSGINGIIQLPLAMISSLSSQCSSVDIYIPFLNVNTQLPCISTLINQKMPAVANILRIAVNGFVLYRIFIDIVGLVKSARNPDEDRLDVLEL